MREFDYVVVGAGTVGCVVATRLSEDTGARELLVEAGSSARTRAMAAPGAWPENLGGSGAINVMAHVRGHRAVYDGWAASGRAGRGFADLLPYFQRSARAEGHDPALRETGGPVRVAPVPETRRHPVARALAEALSGAGCPVTGDLSGARQEGVARVDLAIADGKRISAAHAYLRAAPLIDPGFLREQRDVDRLEAGLEVVQEAAASAAFVGLRVADASVLPVLPNAHPNATILAIAERAAELITGGPAT